MFKHLYDELAKRWLRGGSVYIYSDPHFNDPEMVHLRKNYIGDDEQVKSINKVVGKNDTIIFLGDIGDVSFIKRVRGYKVLIMGNHEKGASNYKRKIEYILDEEHGSLEYDLINKLREEDNHLFDEVYEGPLMVNDRLILSHEPIPVPDYMFNISGHDHSNWYKAKNHLNVCAEHIDYTPVNLINLLKKGLLKDIESIHRTAIDKAIERKK